MVVKIWRGWEYGNGAVRVMEEGKALDSGLVKAKSEGGDHLKLSVKLRFGTYQLSLPTKKITI